MSDEPITRRDAIRATAAVTLSAIAAPVVAQVETATRAAATAPTSVPASLPTSTPATTAAAWITADDVASLETLTDQSFDAQRRDETARGLSGLRGAFNTIRDADTPEGAAPAFHFDVRAAAAAPSKQSASVVIATGDVRTFEGDLDSIAFASVVELRRLLDAKRVTSVELTRYFLGRCARLAPTLHCIINLTKDRALRQAAAADARIAAGERSPLLGIPYGIKDLFTTRGTPTTYGVEIYKNQMLDDDAAVVRKLDAAGAVLIAKTSMGELAQGDVWFGGKTRNPWNPKEGSSGSSAGSASGVAAGLFPFAIGTETLGSILSPCATCGVVGLRPTFGRVSRGGAMALCWTMDKVGPIARRVEDLALIFAALHGRGEAEQDAATRDVPFAWDGNATDLAGLRIGVDVAAFDAMKRDTPGQREVADAYDAMRKQIEQLAGRPFVPVTLPPAKDFNGITSLIINVESSAAFAKMRRRGDLPKLVQQGPGTWPHTFRVGSMIPAVDYLGAMQLRARLQREMIDALRDVDCYVSPVWSTPTLAFTNLCGQPTVISRCGLRSGGGVPISFQIVGSLDREDAALRVAHAYEQATDWWKATPTV